MQPKYAIAVEKSLNSKTGEVSATYASQASCPRICPLRDSGCYAEHGCAGVTTHRLNKASEGKRITPEAIAREEARAIRGLTGERPLRVHVVGDCRTNASARIIADAMMAHTAKHGQPAWTYTHAWRVVKRESWGTVDVLASCESVAEIREANDHGYIACIVVGFHDSWRAYLRDDKALIPCPAQTRGKTCVECKLCMNTELLRWRGGSIAFAASGLRAKRVRERVS